MSDQPDNHSQYNVNWRRVVKILAIILAFILIPIGIAYGVAGLIFLVFWLLLFDVVEPMLLVLYAVLIIGAMMASYHRSRKLPLYMKAANLAGTFFTVLFLIMLLSGLIF